MRRRWLGVSFALVLGSSASAEHGGDWFSPPGPFTLEGRGIGGARPAPAQPAYLAGGRIAAEGGGGALAIDADSGMLLRTDASGAKVEALAIGKNAAMLVVDPVAQRAYVADREGDRIVVIALGDRMTLATTWAMPAREPYGLALSPDRKTLFVTAIADRRLVELDAATGRVIHATAIDREPRGVAVSPDGTRVLVTHLTTSAASEITIADHRVAPRALATRSTLALPRAAFAALYVADHLAVIPFQRSQPQPHPMAESSSDHYGGQDEAPPIQEVLAFVGKDRQVGATTNVQQPRALARDGARDALYVAGLGNDVLVRVVRSSQVDAETGGSVGLTNKTAKERCGPDGVAVAADGSVLVWCSFSRTIAKVALDAKGRMVAPTFGPTLVASTLDPVRHEGMELFHLADRNVSSFGSLACASCHLDGRADGLSWRIHGDNLNTPMLGGRLAETAPFKWDGKAADLPTSVRATVTRLGGDGLAKRHVSSLVAYLEAMPPVRAPSGDPAAVTRGKALFDSAAVGCTQCHDGAALTDRETHQLAGSKVGSGGNSRHPIDTPSLRGLAASAPYFHDGSAATLEALLRERGTVHGMAEASRTLTDAQVRDMVAFLESL